MKNLLLNPPQKPNFLVPGLNLQPGTITVFAGQSNAAKTWLLLELASKLATGLPFYFDNNSLASKNNYTKKIRNKPIHITHIDYEVGEKETCQKLDRMVNAMGINYPQYKFEDIFANINCNYHYQSGHMIGKFNREDQDGFIKRLYEVISDKHNSVNFDEKETSKVIFIDHLSALNSSEENSNSDMAQICNALRETAQKTNAAIVILHHTAKVNISNKSKRKKEVDLSFLRGAGAIGNCVNAAYILENTDGRVDVSQVKRAYYDDSSLLSFNLNDIQDDNNKKHIQYFNDYEKSFGLELVSNLSFNNSEDKLKLDKIIIKEVLLGVQYNTSEIIEVLRNVKKIQFDDKNLNKLLKEMVECGDLEQVKGAKNSNVYGVAK